MDLQLNPRNCLTNTTVFITFIKLLSHHFAFNLSFVFWASKQAQNNWMKNIPKMFYNFKKKRHQSDSTSSTKTYIRPETFLCKILLDQTELLKNLTSVWQDVNVCKIHHQQRRHNITTGEKTSTFSKPVSLWKEEQVFKKRSVGQNQAWITFLSCPGTVCPININQTQTPSWSC